MWPAFPHEKHEGKCGQIPWHKGGGTQEFPPEDGETAEFFEMKLTDKDDETEEFLETEFTDWVSCC